MQQAGYSCKENLSWGQKSKAFSGTRIQFLNDIIDRFSAVAFHI
jgi:hypothetical protein